MDISAVSNLPAKPILAARLADRGEIESREHEPRRGVGHHDDPAGRIDGEGVPVAARRGIIGIHLGKQDDVGAGSFRFGNNFSAVTTGKTLR